MTPRRLVEWLLVLGTALTIYWRPLTSRIPVKPSDIVFALALCAWAWLLLSGGRARMRAGWNARLLIPLLVLLVSLIVATIAGYARYHLTMSRDGVILIGRLVACGALCLAACDLMHTDRTMAKRLSLALLSPIVLLPALLVPAVSTSMWESAGRFQGLTVNPNTADLALCVALAVAYTLAVYEWRSERPRRAAAFAVVAAGTLALIVWTQSRAYLVGGLASIAVGTSLAVPHQGLARVRTTALAAVAFLVITAAAVLFAPRSFVSVYVKKLTLETTEPAAPSRHDPPASSNWAVVDGKLVFGQRGTVGVARHLPGAARKVVDSPHLQAALLYGQLLPSNPLGLGVNYEQKFFIYFAWSRDRHHGTNSIMDIPIYGGMGALLAVGYLMALVVKSARSRAAAAPDEAFPYATGAAAAFGGLWVAAILLGSPIFDYQLWIVTAIALA